MRPSRSIDRVDRVARRARHLADDRPLLPDEPVEERRLADVRAPEDRDADRLVARPARRRAARQPLEDLVEQVADVRAVQPRDRDRLAEAEPVQLERERLLRGIVDLVREQQHRLLRPRGAARRAPRRPASRRRARRRRTARGRRRRSPPAPARAICVVMWSRSARSTPPVSISRNSSPFHSQTSSLRSRVVPCVACTTAAREPVSRLISVDLPTFGKPTIATVPFSSLAVLTAAARGRAAVRAGARRRASRRAR